MYICIYVYIHIFIYRAGCDLVRQPPGSCSALALPSPARRSHDKLHPKTTCPFIILGTKRPVFLLFLVQSARNLSEVWYKLVSPLVDLGCSSYLVAASVCHEYSVYPSIRPICTRC